MGLLPRWVKAVEGRDRSPSHARSHATEKGFKNIVFRARLAYVRVRKRLDNDESRRNMKGIVT